MSRSSRFGGIPTQRAFRNALATIRLGVARLSALKPPSQDAARYADFLERVRHALAFIEAHGAELLALTKQLESATPNSKHELARGQRLLRQIEALERPAERDSKLAQADARALGLGACATAVGG